MTTVDRNPVTHRQTERLHIRLARSSEQPLLEALIASCNLPLAGFAVDGRTTLVARKGDKVGGCAALELYGNSALLRSLAVEVPLRRQGLGRELVAAATALAKRRGVTQVYLLTTTAAPFFEKLGWSRISRAQVPQAVTTSVEFQEACPQTAAVYRLSLP